jgi:hypothetical protein
VPTPNGSSVGEKLTKASKASIDLREGLPNAVLGDSKNRRALTLHTTHLKIANFITSMPTCDHAIAFSLLTTIQFGSGDRFFRHRYCGALRQENSIDIRPAASKDN